MTCQDCLHYDVCKDNGSAYSEKGGAEQCYFSLKKNIYTPLYRRLNQEIIRDVIKILTNYRLKSRRFSDIIIVVVAWDIFNNGDVRAECYTETCRVTTGWQPSTINL